MTRWMARYTGTPPEAPGPAHAIAPRKPGQPSWRSPVTYCGMTAASAGFPSRVIWQEVIDPEHICPKCWRKMPTEPTVATS